MLFEDLGSARGRLFLNPHRDSDLLVGREARTPFLGQVAHLYVLDHDRVHGVYLAVCGTRRERLRKVLLTVTSILWPVRNFFLRLVVAGLLTVAACLPGLASLRPFHEALIATPGNDSEITTAIDIVGTASDAHLAQWTLSFAPANTGNFTQIATGSTSIVNGVLGRFDPTKRRPRDDLRQEGKRNRKSHNHRATASMRGKSREFYRPGFLQLSQGWS